jgi:uncharacterized protein (DUF433 family)
MAARGMPIDATRSEAAKTAALAWASQRRSDQARFEVPIYSVGDAARYLSVPNSTMRDWARGYRRRSLDRKDVEKGAIITAMPPTEGRRLPFVGLVEALVVAAFRERGLSLQHIRQAVNKLKARFGEHALASRDIYTDGARILYDESRSDHEIMKLVDAGSDQRVFHQVIRDYLERISFDDIGASRVILPVTTDPLLEVRPDVNFGHPQFISSGAPLQPVLDRLHAGESARSVAEDFGLRMSEVTSVGRAFGAAAA